MVWTEVFSLLEVFSQEASREKGCLFTKSWKRVCTNPSPKVPSMRSCTWRFTASLCQKTLPKTSCRVSIKIRHLLCPSPTYWNSMHILLSTTRLSFMTKRWLASTKTGKPLHSHLYSEWSQNLYSNCPRKRKRSRRKGIPHHPFPQNRLSWGTGNTNPAKTMRMTTRSIDTKETNRRDKTQTSEHVNN